MFGCQGKAQREYANAMYYSDEAVVRRGSPGVMVGISVDHIWSHHWSILEQWFVWSSHVCYYIIVVVIIVIIITIIIVIIITITIIIIIIIVIIIIYIYI